MTRHEQFFIGGRWVEPARPATLDVIDPSTEQPFTRISVGSAADVDRAVAAARAAFDSFPTTSREERLALLRRSSTATTPRADDLAEAVSREMGAPLAFARDAQVWAGRVHLEATIEALETYEFSRLSGSTLIVREPIGVAALITPWNWPLNQIVCKVAPALAAGCAVVLKPSEIAPISGADLRRDRRGGRRAAGRVQSRQRDGAGRRPGDGGAPGVDMVSFTGSTRAGILVAKAAADTVKRVAQELGGKSPNLILRDADFAAAVGEGVKSCFSNSGQSCDAPTRMLVPAERHDEALAIAAAVADGLKVGDPARRRASISGRWSARPSSTRSSA